MFKTFRVAHKKSKHLYKGLEGVGNLHYRIRKMNKLKEKVYCNFYTEWLIVFNMNSKWNSSCYKSSWNIHIKLKLMQISPMGVPMKVVNIAKSSKMLIYYSFFLQYYFWHLLTKICSNDWHLVGCNTYFPFWEYAKSWQLWLSLL